MALAALAALLASEADKHVIYAGADKETLEAVQAAKTLVNSAALLLGVADEFLENAEREQRESE